MAAGSTTISYGVEARSVPKGAAVLVGRVFFSLIFILAGLNHFTKQMIAFAASQGVPVASIAVPLSGEIGRAHV